MNNLIIMVLFLHTLVVFNSTRLFQKNISYLFDSRQRQAEPPHSMRDYLLSEDYRRPPPVLDHSAQAHGQAARAFCLYDRFLSEEFKEEWKISCP